MSLKDKVIFISGGSRYWLSYGKKAAQDGAKIVIAAKTADPHPKYLELYIQLQMKLLSGGDALPIICDIRRKIMFEML